MRGLIFNIQRYSLHDGDGIRTVVFFKGCPLRCRWCCNPESQNAHSEISYVRSKCIGKTDCAFCARVCAYGAISFGTDFKAIIDRSKCTGCLHCVNSCPSKAIRAEGRYVTVEEILDSVERDVVFYKTNGGLTISGGEPLMQSDFLIELLREAKRRRINTAMETCGFANYNSLRQVASLLDMILYDIKSLDTSIHKEWTDQDNNLILENFSRLCVDFPQLQKLVRMPVIPEFNEHEIDKIRNFSLNHPGTNFEALPYHRFGIGKYEALGRKYTL